MAVTMHTTDPVAAGDPPNPGPNPTPHPGPEPTQPPPNPVPGPRPGPIPPAPPSPAPPSPGPSPSPSPASPPTPIAGAEEIDEHREPPEGFLPGAPETGGVETAGPAWAHDLERTAPGPSAP